MADRFDEAIDAFRDFSGGDAELVRPIPGLVGVTGAAISTMGFLAPETIAASDHRAARLDEAQFDLGEGPCWDAVASGRPVIEPDLHNASDRHWPALVDSLRNEGIGAVYAFPISVGALPVGAVDLYSAEPKALDELDVRRAVAIAGMLGHHVLRHALARVSNDEFPNDASPFSRRVVHQATGFVVAQLGISVEEAVLLIQGHAFSTGRPVREVAEGILEGRQGFRTTGNMIEDER